jgi:hypothetical protein
MKKGITKSEAQDFKKRWEAVNIYERKELQETPFLQKLEKLAVLMASVKPLGWFEALSEDEEGVRERWKRLKRAYHETT